MDSPRFLMPPVRTASVVILVAFALCRCGGGSGRTPKLPDEESVVGEFGPPASPPPSGSRWEVYLDGSRSMKGYAQGRGTYSSVIHDLADFLASKEAVCGVRYYRFGRQPETFRSDRLRTAARQVESYEYSRTDLGEVLSRLAPESWGHRSRPEVPAAALVITDGVQSRASTSSPDIIEPIARWLSWGYEVGIIAVRSEFSGPAYSELRRESGRRELLGEYRSGRDTTRFRPFYVFVLSTQPDAFDEVLSRISGLGLRDPLIRHLRLKRELLRPKSLRVSAPRTTQGKKNPIRVRRMGRRLPVAVLSWAGDPKDTGPGSIVLRMEFEPSDAARQLLSDNLNCELLTLVSKIHGQVGRTGLTGKATGTRATRQKNGRITLDVEIMLDRFTPAGEHVAKLEVCLGPGELTPPGWVAEASTERDDYLSYFNKTLYFNRVVRNIMSVETFARQPVGEVYLYMYKP